MDVFSLVGKITINYAEAEKGLEKISSSAEDAAESLEDVDKKANDAGDSVEGSGKAARNADGGFSVWKATLANLASTAITAVIQKCEQLAGKMVALTQTAVGNYADYEQLVGGVETLFGENSSTLVGYAESAYKTVQLSSNEYMETATSFAASLIQGLGGDTKEAVRLTDVAITDMADNANKMGTDIGSIQNAYQGFAKQTYTMLDNLKLGYDGTKSEMIRLINDSGILNEKIDSLDGVTFDQMIEAIHEIQTEMGITGTSAEEAGTTISGSWNSVKAMFENILTKVGGQLAPTIMSFLNQLQEWMDTVDWDAFAEDVGNAFGPLLEWIQDIDFEQFFQAGIDGIREFLKEVAKIIAKIPQAVSWFKKWAPTIKAVVTAIGTMMVIGSVISMITSLVSTISKFASPVGIAIVAITALVSAIVYLWTTSETFRNVVTGIFNGIASAISTAVNSVVSFFQSLPGTFSGIWETIKSVFSTAINAISGFVSGMITNIQTAWTTVSQVISSVMTIIKDTISTAWETIKNVVQTALMFVVGLITAAITLITLPWQFIWENCKQYIIAAWEVIKSAVSNALTNIQTVITTVWNAIVAIINTVSNTIKQVVSTAWNAIKTTITTVVNAINTIITPIWNAIKTMISTVLNSIKSTVSTTWTSIKTTISTVVNSIKSTVSTVFNSVKSTISTIMDGIKSKFSSVWSGIKSTVSTAISGIKSTISGGLNTAKSTVTSVLDSIKGKFSGIFESCKSIVTGAISAIKSAFNFSWSLPSLKLPHISISGSFSINPPSVPHFGISWYKKAMEDGMIMNSPTIFGFDPTTNKFLAGGEAGSETVVGTNSLRDMIQSAVNGDGDHSSKLDELIALIENMVLSVQIPVYMNGVLTQSEVEKISLNALNKSQRKYNSARGVKSVAIS